MAVYYLYWICRFGHTDIMSEGYIGVSHTPKRRIIEHKSRAENAHLTNALIKYPDTIQTILLVGSKEYCLEIEQKIRPIKNIGWNIAPGGSIPPSHKGKKHPEVKMMMLSKRNPMNSLESRIKVSLSKKGNRQPWVRITGQSNKGMVMCRDRSGNVCRVPQSEFDEREDLVGLRSKIR